MGFESFVKNVAAEREKRFRDPTFQAELGREKLKTLDSLNTMGKNGLDAAYTLLLKAPLTPLWEGLQMIAGKKGNISDVFLKTFGEFMKGGWKATQFAASALVAGGRATKLGIRYLTAL